MSNSDMQKQIMKECLDDRHRPNILRTADANTLAGKLLEHCLGFLHEKVVKAAEPKLLVYKGIIEAADAVRSVLAKPLPLNHVVDLWLRGKQMIDASSAMLSCGGSGKEQYVNQIGSQTFSLLLSIHSEYAEVSGAIDDKLGDHESLLEFAQDLVGILKEEEEKAQACIVGFREAGTQVHHKQIEDAISNLSTLNKGMIKGGSWKEGLSEDSGWDDVARVATGVLFKQKGLKGMLEGAMRTARECFAFDALQPSLQFVMTDDHKDQIESSLRLAQCTLSEAFVLQLVLSTSHLSSLKSKFASELQLLGKAGVPRSQLHPAISAKMSEVVAM